jgi:hypothetical protein
VSASFSLSSLAPQRDMIWKSKFSFCGAGDLLCLFLLATAKKQQIPRSAVGFLVARAGSLRSEG